MTTRRSSLTESAGAVITPSGRGCLSLRLPRQLVKYGRMDREERARAGALLAALRLLRDHAAHHFRHVPERGADDQRDCHHEIGLDIRARAARGGHRGTAEPSGYEGKGGNLRLHHDQEGDDPDDDPGDAL